MREFLGEAGLGRRSQDQLRIEFRLKLNGPPSAIR